MMAVTGIEGNYNAYGSAYAAQKNEAAQKKAAEKAEGKESHVITSTVELKTSTPGKTRMEQIQTGYSNVNDYSKYLQDKYRYMNTGTTSMQGVPTTVSVSGAFLKKCMNDSEKATYLEENLAAIPDCVSHAISHSIGTLTSISIQMDANGNITMMSTGTNDPDGRIARENAERKAKEQKENEEKLEKKRSERKEQEEHLAELRAKRKAEGETLQSHEIIVVGSDVRDLTEKMIAAMKNPNSTAISKTAGFDLKI